MTNPSPPRTTPDDATPADADARRSVRPVICYPRRYTGGGRPTWPCSVGPARACIRYP